MSAKGGSVDHHKDCDGWIMHSVQVERDAFGTWIPVCPIGDLHVIGSAGSQETARAMGRGHEASVPCAGECRSW